MPREPSLERLEHLDRRPIWTFFSDEQMTSARLNTGIVAIALTAIVGAATGDGHPIVLIFAVAAGWMLWRNYRRFRERVRWALQERTTPQAP